MKRVKIYDTMSRDLRNLSHRGREGPHVCLWANSWNQQ